MDIILKTYPIILLFALGFFLKKMKLLKKNHAEILLKFVFFVSLPALMFISVLKINISIQMLYLAIIPFIIVGIIFLISYYTGRKLKLNNKDLGVFLIGTMIMNVGFTYPFIIAGYGEEGLARISFFNFSNGLIVFTFVYYCACHYGNGTVAWKNIILKLLLSFPLWALLLAIFFNINNYSIPHSLENIFRVVGNLTIPLIMLSLGVYFELRIINPKPFTTMIIIRQILGLFIGLILIKLFRLEGLDKIIVIIGSAAPIGYNTLVFSTLEGLNKEFAASIVSASILIGIIYIPLLMFIFSI